MFVIFSLTAFIKLSGMYPSDGRSGCCGKRRFDENDGSLCS